MRRTHTPSIILLHYVYMSFVLVSVDSHPATDVGQHGDTSRDDIMGGETSTGKLDEYVQRRRCATLRNGLQP